ncbi:MAG: flagellar biosynthesis anti-sigma factor FlgM [Treponema sp.]|jgi:anti-sigma28 factor (negative regulator of flagellin synthesis)|nr:flagellar biosynthesis anti-sigma factor FlgM [Treponema sp.]
MMIDRIGSVNSVFLEGANRNSQINKERDGDSIRVSQAALEQNELYQAEEIVHSAPDSRVDLVAEIKAQIDDPSFLNDAVLDATVEKILAALKS